MEPVCHYPEVCTVNAASENRMAVRCVHVHVRQETVYIPALAICHGTLLCTFVALHPIYMGSSYFHLSIYV